MNTQTQFTGNAGSPFKTRYDNYIGGKWVAPVNGRYMDNITPITGAVVCEVTRSDAAAGPETSSLLAAYRTESRSIPQR